jgi:hypothetical protein
VAHGVAPPCAETLWSSGFFRSGGALRAVGRVAMYCAISSWLQARTFAESIRPCAKSPQSIARFIVMGERKMPSLVRSLYRKNHG